LVQNTAWRNADLAVTNLRAATLLDARLLANSSVNEVQGLIRPAGFHRQKSETLFNLSRQVIENFASFDGFLARPTATVRDELLSLRGIGPETADSILLYGGGHEVFVVDVYLRRFLVALGLEPLSKLKYEELRVEMQALVAAQRDIVCQTLAGLHAHSPSHAESAMSRAARSPLADIYSELHAVLVRDGIEKRRTQRVIAPKSKRQG
jgi:endonuclease-3 related protein